MLEPRKVNLMKYNEINLSVHRQIKHINHQISESLTTPKEA